MVMTDNGPQFTAEEFRKFAQKYDFEHVTSSPHYPRSNGKVEATVKSAKRMLKKVLDHRSLPPVFESRRGHI